MTHENRPVSRRGSKTRTSSPVMESNARPTSSNRPTTAMRAPSSMSQYSRGSINTGNRLVTGLALPRTNNAVNATARPITQQGLSGLRTGTARTQQRQVLDKRYFEGVIRQRMNDIASEVKKLTMQIETHRQHEATSDLYDSRVKEVATELTTLQSELTDLNQVVDRVHTGGNFEQIIEETKEVRAENAREAVRLEQLFQRNYEMEQQIHRSEAQIQNEKTRTLKLLDDMDVEQREQYERLNLSNEQCLQEILQQQQHLDQLKTRSGILHDKISSSQLKEEALQLYQKLWEREERKEQLEQEARNKATPAQEREQLLQKVREDNAEMAAMERQITQMNEQLRNLKQEVELVEQDLEESQSDRHQKLKELKRREETMEQFMSSFEENRTAEFNRIQVLEGKIEVALQQMARNRQRPGTLPSRDEFSALKETLEIKQEELDKSKMTSEELTKEEAKLQLSVKKVEELEEKINNELATLREKMQQMNADMMVFEDLDTLHSKAQKKRNELNKLHESLVKRKSESPSEKLNELKAQHEHLLKELNENDTYVQLHTLEKKLQLLQQNNESLKGSLATRRSELDYAAIRSKALLLLNQYNSKLQKRPK